MVREIEAHKADRLIVSAQPNASRRSCTNSMHGELAPNLQGNVAQHRIARQIPHHQKLASPNHFKRRSLVQGKIIELTNSKQEMVQY
jgi:hypothetical protein